jgi:acetyl esterase/lipase
VPVPDAIAVQYPAVDPIAIYERGFPIPGFEPAMLMAGYVGGTPSEFPDRVAAIASENFITPAAPPTLIIAPEKDSLVVSDGVYGFADKARAGGVDIELVRIPFANHIYNQVAYNSLGNQAGRTIRLRFLEQHVP